MMKAYPGIAKDLRTWMAFREQAEETALVESELAAHFDGLSDCEATPAVRAAIARNLLNHPEVHMDALVQAGVLMAGLFREGTGYDDDHQPHYWYALYPAKVQHEHIMITTDGWRLTILGDKIIRQERGMIDSQGQSTDDPTEAINLGMPRRV